MISNVCMSVYVEERGRGREGRLLARLKDISYTVKISVDLTLKNWQLVVRLLAVNTR